MHPSSPSSIHLHPAPPSSTQLISVSTQLSATPSTIFEPKYCTNWAISPNLGQKLKVVHLTENWHTWYIGGTDSQYRLRFLKFRPQKPFLGKFGPKSSMLFVLSENWCKFGQIWVQNFRVVSDVWKLVHMVS